MKRGRTRQGRDQDEKRKSKRGRGRRRGWRGKTKTKSKTKIKLQALREFFFSQRTLFLKFFAVRTEFRAELSLTHSCGKPGQRHRAFRKSWCKKVKRKKNKSKTKRNRYKNKHSGEKHPKKIERQSSCNSKSWQKVSAPLVWGQFKATDTSRRTKEKRSQVQEKILRLVEEMWVLRTEKFCRNNLTFFESKPVTKTHHPLLLTHLNQSQLKKSLWRTATWQSNSSHSQGLTAHSVPSHKRQSLLNHCSITAKESHSHVNVATTKTTHGKEELVNSFEVVSFSRIYWKCHYNEWIIDLQRFPAKTRKQHSNRLCVDWLDE